MSSKEEKTQINFLQETHLSRPEHEKLKKFGYKHTYYSSNTTNTRKRGVAILISNQVNFECQKEINDKEGRFVIIKGTIDEGSELNCLCSSIAARLKLKFRKVVEIKGGS